MRAVSLGAVACLALGAVALHSAQAAPAAAVAAEAFDPVTFFSGATEGRGRLKKVMSSARTTYVTGRGTMRRDGTFAIDQTVAIAGDPVKTRQWLLREIAPGRFGGSLSDASGPVSATVAGPRLSIRYSMNGGLAVEQVLVLAPGGRSARNLMKIRKFGIVVATLDETIRKV
jgi:hypothetical protein